MPDPQGMQNLLMTHMPDLQGGKCPTVAPGGFRGMGAVQIDWCIITCNYLTLCVSLTRVGAIKCMKGNFACLIHKSKRIVPQRMINTLITHCLFISQNDQFVE